MLVTCEMGLDTTSISKRFVSITELSMYSAQSTEATFYLDSGHWVPCCPETHDQLRDTALRKSQGDKNKTTKTYKPKQVRYLGETHEGSWVLKEHSTAQRTRKDVMLKIFIWIDSWTLATRQERQVSHTKGGAHQQDKEHTTCGKLSLARKLGNNRKWVSTCDAID